jgi:uncharacterized membrane protein
MNRNDLDAFVRHYALSEDGVAKAFELTHAVPGRAETLQFLLRILRIGGVLSLAAGVVFFIAANWDKLGLFGHFALVQILFVLAVGLAWWWPPPSVAGRLALLFAFITAGGLLALFGQTYQTGADVYELFFMWALLGLPLVLASKWSVCWAAWLMVLNVALILFYGFNPALGMLGFIFFDWESNQALSLLIPMAINLALWFATELVASPRIRAVASRWLRRIALGFGVIYATWAATYLITSEKSAYALLTGLAVFGALAAIAFFSFRKREDVLPVAALTASLIFLGLIFIGENTNTGDLGLFFILALWLIGASTVAGRLLTKLQRTWFTEDAA